MKIERASKGIRRIGGTSGKDDTLSEAGRLPHEAAARHGRRYVAGLLSLLLTVLVVSPVMAATGGFDAVLSLQAQMEASYARINDYQAIFHKQELVDGKLLPEETILLKFQKPFKIYMQWIEEPLKGTEALFVRGEYDNKVIGHKGGILGIVTAALDPKGSMAMKGNRHPITEAGFGFVIEEMRRNIDKAIQNGDLEIVRLGEEAVKGRPATVIETRFKSGGGRKYYAARSVVHIDKELMLPVASAFYDEKNVLFEKYAFDDVKLNVGFKASEFSRYNDAYRF